MAKKYYAIKKGRDNLNSVDVKDMVVTTWDECLSYVKGVKGAIYKSFPSNEEAVAYLNDNNNLKKGEDEYPEDIPHIYVDGSYNVRTEEYGYGVVVVHNDIIVHAHYGNGYDKECNQRQVNGELQGAIEGIEFALLNQYKRVVLFYDYAGVCQHATGAWERNNSLSQHYYEKINELKTKGNIDIVFVKVDSHTGDLYNDIADELAKTGAGVSIDGVTNKAVGKTKIRAASKEIKETLTLIVKNTENILTPEPYLVEREEEVQDDFEATLNKLKELTRAEREKYISKLKKNEIKDLLCNILEKNYN